MSAQAQNLKKTDAQWKRFQSTAKNRKFSNRTAASRSNGSKVKR